MPTALKLNKINDLSGYETVPGPAVPVFIQNDDGGDGGGVLTLGENNNVYGPYALPDGATTGDQSIDFQTVRGEEGGSYVKASNSVGIGTDVAMPSGTNNAAFVSGVITGSRNFGFRSVLTGNDNIGILASSIAANRGIAIGRDSSVGADDAVAIGSNVVNADTDTVKIGVAVGSWIQFTDFTPDVAAAVPSTHTLNIVLPSGTYRVLLATP